MIFADTSFLFALFGGDAHTAAAQNWARQSKVPVAVTALNRFEFANAVRFAEFRKVISQNDAQTTLIAFDKDLQRGIIQFTPCDLLAVLKEAERLSELYTTIGGHRSFDLLHVAAARLLKAEAILTFDLNQRKLASSAKLTVGP